MIEFDLLRDDKHNLADKEFQDQCFSLVRTAHFILVTPPCNTFSRAVWSNPWGPRPIRNNRYIYGFPWLSGYLRHKAETANDLVLFSVECLNIVIQESEHRFCIGFLEHPEDLGIVNRSDPTSIPASIWQWPEVRDLQLQTRALHQKWYGAATVKPTRIAFNEGFEDMGIEGWPSFHNDFTYAGPLGSEANPIGSTLIRVGPSEESSFATAAAAAYPPELCKAIATCAWKARLSYVPSPAGGGYW